MSELKSLLLRINSVKSTKKITRVMQMIAASRLRSAQKSLSYARSFEQRIASAIDHSICHVKDLSQIQKKIGVTNLIFVVASERGLCGGYNSSIFKLARSNHAFLSNDTKIVCVGKKSYDYCKNLGPECIFLSIDSDFAKMKSFVLKLITDFKIASVTLLYTKFKSAMSLVPTAEQIFPVKFDQGAKKSCTTCGFEPDATEVVSKLLDQHLFAKLYLALKESLTSEHMSRMLAMDSATKNAQKVVDELRLKYNLSRQEKITRELIEIISGAEAI